MLQTSTDLLNLVLALSILMVAVAMTWAMVYIIKILKSFTDLGRAIRNTVNDIQSAVAHWQHKIESTASYLPLIMEGIGKIITYFTAKKQSSDSSEDKSDIGYTKKTNKKKVHLQVD